MKTAVATRQNTSEQDTLQFYADASELQLPPGVWPKFIATVLGNREPFSRITHPTAKGTGVGVTYEQPGTGARLHIIND
jgi:hypothetical protein